MATNKRASKRWQIGMSRSQSYLKKVIEITDLHKVLSGILMIAIIQGGMPIKGLISSMKTTFYTYKWILALPFYFCSENGESLPIMNYRIKFVGNDTIRLDFAFAFPFMKFEEWMV